VWGKKGICFYVDKGGELVESNNKDVHSHYVVVTGVEERDDREYIVVSSWGRKYYIDYKEYRSYVNKIGGRFTSSILYIKGIL
jgi:hypothetical protein